MVQTLRSDSTGTSLGLQDSGRYFSVGFDLSVLLERLRIIAKRCERLNIVLSRTKLEIGSEIPFAGCVVSESGVCPDPTRVLALSDFTRPKDITGVRSFLGLANQLAF